MGARADLPRELTEAPGAPGFESCVRDVALRAVAPLGDPRRDRLGSRPVEQAGPGPRGIPARDVHSAASVISPADLDQAVDLLTAPVQRRDADRVRGLPA